MKASANNDSLTLTRSAAGTGHDRSVGGDQGQLFYSFCLEEVVPDDHQVRAIASVLDLSWVYGLQIVAGEVSTPSAPPRTTTNGFAGRVEGGYAQTLLEISESMQGRVSRGLGALLRVPYPARYSVLASPPGLRGAALNGIKKRPQRQGLGLGPLLEMPTLGVVGILKPTIMLVAGSNRVAGWVVIYFGRYLLAKWPLHRA